MVVGLFYFGMMDFVKVYVIDGNFNNLVFFICNVCKDVGYYMEMVESFGVMFVMVNGVK